MIFFLTWKRLFWCIIWNLTVWLSKSKIFIQKTFHCSYLSCWKGSFLFQCNECNTVCFGLLALLVERGYMRTLGPIFPNIKSAPDSQTLGRCHRIVSFFQVNELDQRVLLYLSLPTLIIIRHIVKGFLEVGASTNIFQKCFYREFMLHTILVAASGT